MADYRRIFRLAPPSARELKRELDEEIEAHIEMRAEELVRRGARPEEARAEAEGRFGDLGAARRALYASARRRESRLRRSFLVGSLLRDLALAVRRARRSPGFTALALAVFAAGIGLTTAMFTVVDHVLLRPLPYPDAEGLVILESVDSAGREFPWVSSANWHDWRERNRTLVATALHREARFDVATAEGAFRLSGQRVTGRFFEVLKTPMRVGRAFSEEEAWTDAAVAVVSEGFWHRVLGSSPRLDRGLVIEGRARQIVGVVPAGLEYPRGTEVWLPAASAYRRVAGSARNNINWLAVARLRRTVTAEQTRADLGAIAEGIRRADPVALYSYGVGVRPLRDFVVGDAGGYLAPLMGAVGFVLLIVCANLAGLAFARTTTREREIVVRVALGAGRLRVVRQLVTEYVLLALAGGGLGLALARAATGAVASGAASYLPRAEEIAIDGRVLVFALGVSFVAGALASLAPALRVSATALGGTLGSSRGMISGGRGLPGAVIVGFEIALAVVLLTGSGLMIRSFRSLLARDVGFDPHGVVVADLALTGPRFRDQPDRWLAYWNEAVARARSIPGVGAVGLANWIPTQTGGKGFIQVEGLDDDRAGAGYRVIGGGYFRALAVPLLAGRTFEERDDASSTRVVIVNRRMAETYWPGESPIGRRVKAVSQEAVFHGGEAPWLTVVGVVADVRHYGFEAAPEPEMYVHYRQIPQRANAMNVVVRGAGVPAANLAGALRRQLHELDPTIAADIALLDERLHGLVARERLVVSVLSGFGVLALVVAGLGVYSLLSFVVARRTQEIGVRTALGARRSAVVRLVLANAVCVAAIGGLVGLLGAFWLTKLLEGLLVDVSRTDPLSYLSAALAMLGISIVAGLAPAWRATRLDPLIALRDDR